jgi:hypothetical protein
MSSGSIAPGRAPSAAGAAASASSVALAACIRVSALAVSQRMPPSTRKGRVGRPGTSANDPRMAAATRIACGRAVSWPSRSRDSSDSPAARVTTRPAAVDTSSAGTWVTRPSPTVRIV